MTDLEYEVLRMLRDRPRIGWYTLEQRLAMRGVNTHGHLPVTLQSLLARQLIAETSLDGDVTIDVYSLTPAGEAALNS